MEMLVTLEWLSRHLGADDLVVLDCTVEVGPDFRGASGRPAYEQGHIPSATNVSALMLFDEQGRFRTDEELAALLETERSARQSTYCGGGIAASANALAMTRVGFTDVAVHAASPQERAGDPALPLVTGAD